MGEQTQDTGNGELADVVARAKPADRPAMKQGETYILMPTRVLSAVVKILRRLPYDEVELVLLDLRKLQSVKGKPAE